MPAAVEILASVDDINTHLPTDKIDASDSEAIADINLYQIDAARFVRSMLSGIFTATTLVAWDSPVNTPETIRGIAGRLIAAKYYAIRYAEDNDESKYAQGLYNDAVNMVNAVRSGTLVVTDSSLNPIDTNDATDMTSADFWPNNTTPGPAFTMDKQFT